MKITRDSLYLSVISGVAANPFYAQRDESAVVDRAREIVEYHFDNDADDADDGDNRRRRRRQRRGVGEQLTRRPHKPEIVGANPTSAPS